MKYFKHFKLLGICCLFPASIFAQTPEINPNNIAIPDSVKATIEAVDAVFSNIEDIRYTAKVDSVWKDLIKTSLANKSYTDPKIDSLPEIKKTVSTDTLKARLARLDAKTPFHISYNESLEKVINYYLQRSRLHVEKLMGLSEFYFPMFEQELDKHNIPLEMKYLAIVESALNPRAKSRVGATGLWQFMFTTGKMHGLEVSSYVDERMDPVLATEAACKYLSTLYGIFGDWDLALASYNSGPGNVSKAIRRSGGSKDYWVLRDYLPKETAGYVPAFIATMYLFEYANEHGYQRYKPEITYFDTDTIKVKQLIKFDQIVEATGVDEDVLTFLNPSYKLDIIPSIERETYYLRLPVAEVGKFVANEDKIYEVATTQIAQAEEELPKYYEATDKVRYRVQSGDYLGKIAGKFGVRVSEIKRWNNMRNSSLRAGQYLTIYPKKPNTEGVVVKKSSKTKRSGKKYYTVQEGDSLWSISRKFTGISVKDIQEWNGISGSNLKPGMKLKISG